MSVLINKDTKVIVQGITGGMGKTHAALMQKYGTKIVGGVTPGKGGQEINGVPVFDSVTEAKQKTGANCSVIFVPPYLALDAALEAIDAEIPLISVITEGMVPQDAVKLHARAKAKGVLVNGPNCPGIITPGECLIGIHPGSIYMPGRIGLISRSGTLTYEIGLGLKQAGIGISTAVGIGGDPIIGIDQIKSLELFEADKDTDLIILVGEIGGTAEEDAAEYIKAKIKKPVIGYIAGRTAPPGKRMGHAGAIISGNKGTAESKTKAFEAAGVQVAKTPSEIIELVKKRIAVAA
ncbi:MAG: succinate--CoA ligase subunit alpha [Candidatus Caenarcaniphilales bacterium]|jgi:succinyl-CoA synthetase alpha subunit|nr:succinate--CoA ligase subunit alpha [Candidatus Caenarcaniphilales bacterium]